MEINNELKGKYPWRDTEWTNRTQAIARLIQPGVSVLDLGGGMGNLKKYLHGGEYVSIDNAPWTSATIVADFNKGEYPGISGIFKTSYYAGVMVAQGVIEYMNDPLAFLKAIRIYGHTLIITYREGNSSAAMQHGRVISLPVKQIRQLLNAAGWQVELGKPISKIEHIFYCTRV